MPRQTPNSLTEQMQRLAAEQARIERELAAAEKQARRKPKPARATLEPERRLKVHAGANPVILPPRPEAHRFPDGRVRSTRKKTRRRKSEARYEQTKFLLLCILFFALVLFVWKNIP